MFFGCGSSLLHFVVLALKIHKSSRYPRPAGNSDELETFAGYGHLCIDGVV